MSISWDDHEELKRLKVKLSCRFELRDYLEGGGFGKVFKLYDRTLDRITALKTLKLDRLMDYSEEGREEMKKRFLNEARSYAKFKHPNIVSIYDIGPDDDWPYFIMEYIDGKNLNYIIGEKKKLKFDEALKISEGVLIGLGNLHKNKLVHRDIKPKNIMVDKTDGRIVIIDLGIAKNSADPGMNTTQTFGTPFYMAPEQIEGRSCKILPETDIYAYGVVLFEMLTGIVPFSGSEWAVKKGHMGKKVPNVRKLNPDIPKDIKKIISKAMNKIPAKRFKSAEDFLTALSKVNVTKGSKNKKKRNKLLEIIGVIVTTLSIVLTAITLYNYYSDQGRKEQPSREVITAQQRKNMSKDFELLKTFMVSVITNQAKIEKCREFLARHQNTADNKDTQAMLDEVNRFISNLNAEINTGNQYQIYIDTVKNLIKNEDYEGAKRELEKAGKINNSDEVKRLSTIIEQGLESQRKNGEEGYKTIKDKLTLSQYLAFQSNYSQSIHLPDLRERLKVADKNLPPEKYWDKTISKNSKGYYELTFGNEHNGHLMIYIPEKNFWIDKYEVSWAQFRKYLKDENLSIPSTGSNEYINNGDEFPAVVTYEEAERYCQRYGFRLPKNDEWEYAAGKGISIYPWGNESPDENGIWRANFDSLVGTFEKDGFEGTAPVKSFENFASPFGVVSMSGNVWEWIQAKNLKGGGYLSPVQDLIIDTPGRTGTNDKQGFRCLKEVNKEVEDDLL